MCNSEKQIRLALQGWDSLQAAHAARLTRGSLASKASMPRDTVELSHAREVEASAKTMLAKGYHVITAKQSPDGPLLVVAITGPSNYVWEGEDLRELLDLCPTYCKIEDYALATHEQFEE